MKIILLVFGGNSYEHDISVVTACQIYNKTKIDNVKLIPFYVSRENKFYIYKEEKFVLSDFNLLNFSKFKKKFKEVAIVSNEKNIIFSKTKFGLKELLKAEIAIFATHGGAGENGILQSIFESIGIYSTCGNFDSLAICMNKFFFKQAMFGMKVPTVAGFKITQNDLKNKNKFILNKLNNLKFPVILKSNNGGSSIGLFVAQNEDEFYNKINDAFEFDNEILIENYIENCREFNIAIIGDNDSFVLSEIEEPIKKHDILSFSDKYCSDGGEKSIKNDNSLKNSLSNSSRKFPAEINESLKNQINKFASRIFESLNLRGIVRIDFLFNEEKNKIFVCEVNSIPGSLAFYFFNKNRLLINDFVNKLINIAEKYKDNHFLINKEYYTDILK